MTCQKVLLEMGKSLKEHADAITEHRKVMAAELEAAARTMATLLTSVTEQSWTGTISQKEIVIYTTFEEPRLKYGLKCGIRPGATGHRVYFWGEAPRWDGGKGQFHWEYPTEVGALEDVVKRLNVEHARKLVDFWLQKPVDERWKVEWDSL